MTQLCNIYMAQKSHERSEARPQGRKGGRKLNLGAAVNTSRVSTQALHFTLNQCALFLTVKCTERSLPTVLKVQPSRRC